MEIIAQTNVQLYNQLQRQHRSTEELAQVRRAYDLARNLYSSHFQADGVPFVAHVIGVASIVAQLGFSSDLVAAACLHNVYTAGDFGDGRQRCRTAGRRKLLENAVGQEVEAHVHRFWALLRETPTARLATFEHIDTLTPQDRQLVAMDLADTLELCHDLGPLYYGDNQWIVGYVKREGAALIGLAERLGHPELATMLSSSISRLLSATIPPGLMRANSSQKYARQEIPRSCMRRPAIAMSRAMRRLLRPVRKRASAIQH
ncbi:MAG: HD domain-containing protein [Gammaproteobacteria bacterium]|nr:HD domain-containing protein [Gammaproteobacteria bacterium]